MKRSRESGAEEVPTKQRPADSEDADKPPSKIAELEGSSEERPVGIKCFLPPHKGPLIFSSYEDYEAHYRLAHTNRCLECRKNFPSARFLDLHIEENHDAFAAAKKDKGEPTVSRVRREANTFSMCANQFCSSHAFQRAAGRRA